jgi:ribosomal protein S18 acetylase RimI-like enzyme
MSRRVRGAEHGDAAAIRGLQRHLPDPAPTLLDAALAGAVGDLLVAVDVHERLVGYLLAVDGGPAGVTDATDTTPPASDDLPQVHVAELVVAPSARRRGHASALLATLLGDHPTADVTLTVDPDNTAARSLYERFGFEAIRTLPDRFDGDPGLLLVRRPRTQ